MRQDTLATWRLLTRRSRGEARKWAAHLGKQQCWGGVRELAGSSSSSAHSPMGPKGTQAQGGPPPPPKTPLPNPPAKTSLVLTLSHLSPTSPLTSLFTSCSFATAFWNFPSLSCLCSFFTEAGPSP